MLRICDSIDFQELKLLKDFFGLDILKKSADKVCNGLGVDLGKSMIPNSKIIKHKLTGKHGAGRVVYLLMIQDGNEKTIYPVILKHKNDKDIGDNMSYKNKKFCSLLNKNLNLILTDIEKGDFEDFDI